jgi:hypothetical protein
VLYKEGNREQSYSVLASRPPKLVCVSLRKANAEMKASQERASAEMKAVQAEI